MFRRLASMAFIATLVPLVTAVPGAGAAADSYVALGDSYASGTGTGEFIDDGSQCQRSVHAYPSLISAAKGYDLNFRACSGATIPDVTSGQLGALSAGTAHVTISVGGNDAGFTEVLTECALPAWASDCAGAVGGAQAFIDGTLPGSLSSLYASIRAQAPNADVVTIGYPRIFMGEDCNAATFFSPEDEALLNATADLINSRTAAASSEAGFTFVDPIPSFIGHAVCDSPEWLNGFSSPISESYHPNRAGHADGLTPLVSGPMGAGTVSVTPDVVAAAAASSDDQAERQRGYAASDRTVRPKEFVAPDLDSPRIKAAARAAGVDLGSRASIERAELAARQ